MNNQENQENQLNVDNYFLNNYRAPLTLESHFQPFYDDRKDFNTNANSYYEYLAHLNFLFSAIVKLLNRVARRNFIVNETNSAEFVKINDWIDGAYKDIIELSVNVKNSEHVEEYKYISEFFNISENLTNAIKIFTDGLYAKDFTNVIKKAFDEISKINGNVKTLAEKLDKEILDRKKADNDLNQNILDLENSLDELTKENNLLKNALQKIVNNLYSSGALSSSSLSDFIFNQGRNIATGNINLFSNDLDGQYFIRTNNEHTENDLAGGV